MRVGKTELIIILIVFLCVSLYMLSWLAFGFKPVFLWTDVLVYILVVSIIAFALYAKSKPHLRDPWRQVWRRKLGMSALVILLFYVFAGLLDSVHFRMPLQNQTSEGEMQYQSDVLTVLDMVLPSLHENVEKTYSSPFATHLFAKETIQHDDGSTTREYPRLKFGGAHLDEHASGRTMDVLVNTFIGLTMGLLISVLVIGVILFLLAKHWSCSFKQASEKILKQESEAAWAVVLLTLLLCITLISLLYYLSYYYHVFGTDKVGRDVLYQAIKSIRTGLVIGTLTTLIMLPFAMMLGIMAGYFRGWIDDVIQYLYTTLNSIPGILLIAAAVLMMQIYMANHPELFETDSERADTRLFFLCIILGITSWTGLCRMLRGEALKLREMDYIQAASAFGVSNFKIIWRHIQPNVMHIILIAVVLDFSGLVLAEAVLSYVGVGVDPTTYSWGNLINGARLEMAREPLVWWSLLAAFIFMFILVLAANLFSDAVRDAFDPRIRKQ